MDATLRPPRAPRFVGLFNPVARRLLGAGIPLGPNALLTVRGRKSGLPRVVPVALIEDRGRRWVLGTFGDTNWVRNLRAAGAAQLKVGRRMEDVTAIELPPEEAAQILRTVLRAYVARIRIGNWLLRGLLGAGEMLDDPDGAARRHPMFELRTARP